MKSVATLLLLMVGAPSVVCAALTRATWGTSPAAPVYVGQVYDLTLTLETASDEEISELQTDQGPSRNPDSQTTAVQDGVRRTTFRWSQCEAAPKLVAFPAGRLIAGVTRVQNFGFSRFASTSRQAVEVPAFSYEAVTLPGEAAGAPIGDFTLRLTADSPTYRAGDVRVLTAELRAKSGRVPAQWTPRLAEAPAGAYPFREVERTESLLRYQAYFVTAEAESMTVRLEPLKAFDLTHRALSEVACPPLTLTQQVAAPEGETAAPEAPRERVLRFAPTEGAPILGVLAAGEPWRETERSADWVRIELPGGASGWLKAAELKE